MKPIFFLLAVPLLIQMPINGYADTLNNSDIFQKCRETYDSLTSYADEGEYCENLDGTIVTAHFKTKMKRPNLYRVTWEYDSSKANAAAWSTGDGDFITKDGKIIKNEDEAFASFPGGISKERIQELGRETVLSDNNVLTLIPGIFFKLFPKDSPLHEPPSDEKRLPDETINNTDCYVLAGQWRERMRTVWIAKQDYMIRKILLVKTKDSQTGLFMSEADERLTKMLPNPPLVNGQSQSATSYQIYSNIIRDQNFSADDFLYQSK